MDLKGLTTLMLASQQGNIVVVEILIEYCAGTEKADEKGMTALLILAS